MQKRTEKIVLILLFAITGLRSQDKEIERLIENEFKMTFPSIYFKNNSTDYAEMPYTVESCLKYITANIKDIKNFVIWKDSSETDQLTKKRIEKIKNGLKKYAPADKVNILAMGEAQRISRFTIKKGVTDTQIQYLLSLNSVLDISATRVSAGTRTHCCLICAMQGKCSLFKKRGDHATDPRRWCPFCWVRVSKGVQKFKKN